MSLCVVRSCSQLLWLVMAFRVAASALGMVARDPDRKGSTAHHRETPLLTKEFWKSSPATASIEDHQRVREILKDRHARRQPRLEAELPPRFTANDFDFEDSEYAQENLWLSLPRRPKRNATQLARSGDTSEKRSSKTKRMVRPNGINIPFEYTMEALQVFHDKNSHLAIPRHYLVPESSSYPSVWHGLDLAGTVYTMGWWQHHVQGQPDRVSELNRIGFVWERLQPEWNLILESLIVYKSLHGNVLVPSTFVVPYDDDRWPESCWGIALGNSVYKIRNRGDHLGGRNPNGWSRRNQLDALGFVWDVDEVRFSRFRAALEWFGKLEQRPAQDPNPAGTSSVPTHSGALMVPSRFVVPENSDWPNDLWGYRLGERCTQVRQKELYVKSQPHRIRILADLGFYVAGGSNSNLRWLEVVHAAAVYSQMHSNRLDVPTSFVVPAPPRRLEECPIDDDDDNQSPCVIGSDDAWPWPGKLHDIREHAIASAEYPDESCRLVPGGKILAHNFHLFLGAANIYRNEESLWGFPLGQRLRDIRVKGYYLKGKNSGARRRQLDALGFNWEPKRGRPSRKT